MGTTYIKYPWDTSKGTEITNNELKAGTEMFDKVNAWCNDHALGEFEVDKKIYAKGIKVKLADAKDTKRLKAYMEGVKVFVE